MNLYFANPTSSKSFEELNKIVVDHSIASNSPASDDTTETKVKYVKPTLAPAWDKRPTRVIGAEQMM